MPRGRLPRKPTKTNLVRPRPIITIAAADSDREVPSLERDIINAMTTGIIDVAQKVHAAVNEVNDAIGNLMSIIDDIDDEYMRDRVIELAREDIDLGELDD